MSSTKKELLSTTMKRTSEWIFSQEIPSDITIRVGSASFPLHKFPLVSKCGYFRKLVSDSKNVDPFEIEIPDVPGGTAAFELAANFCYGVNFEISIDNIAMLRCVAEYLEMTEECAVGNLIGRAEVYLTQVALQNLSGSISVLHSSENLSSAAEDVKLVSRCIDAIANLACNDTQSCFLDSRAEAGLINTSVTQQKQIVDWWAEDLTLLRIDLFQRVLIALMARGFKQYALGPILMLYAQNNLRGLDISGKVKKRIEPREEHEKRVVLETLVSLLPKEKNSMPISFLAMLLRFSKYLETTGACRLDLEKRMALQLEQAVVDDLLIPSYSLAGETLFDVDTVKRIIFYYLEDYISPRSCDVERVGKLMEDYLAEIASDCNLTVANFIGVAQLFPAQSRVIEDGMYRAIDIFLKAHPDAGEMERKKVCSMMECQKLSREACSHAAQNDRLPVQTVVQLLYYEQERMRIALSGESSPAAAFPTTTTNKEQVLAVYAPSDEMASLRRENEKLKIELVKTKMRLKEMERSVSSSPAHKPARPRKSFLASLSKKLGMLYPLIKADVVNPPTVKARNKPRRVRRHSIS